MFSKKKIGLFCFSILLLSLGWFLPRAAFIPLIIIFGLAFGIYYWMIQQTYSNRLIFWVGVGLRVGLLFAYPLLSNDIFRFIWDGRLLVAGQDPFALRPSEWMTLQVPPIGITKELHQLIYADNYTVYPPVHQFVFWLSARFSTSIMGAVFILKSFLILSEIGLLFLIKQSKYLAKLNPKLLLIYALNPLIILEISGNGHFEGLMVLFLILGFLSLHKKQYHLGGIGFGLAIATKLLPLMLVPLFWQYLPRKGMITFMSSLLLVNILLWFPLWQMGSLHHLLDSIWLYFESFEFNASIYYLLQWLLPNGWRIGLVTNGITLLVMAWLTLRQKELNEKQLVLNILIAWGVYILNSAIVHPWYLIPVLALSALGNLRIGIFWTGLVFLSYSHYFGGLFQEHYWMLSLEYILLGVALLFEIMKYRLIKVKDIEPSSM